MRLSTSHPSSVVTEGPLLRGIGYLALPMLGSAVLQNLQSLIDLFWVGSLGPAAVAAVAMAGTILMVLFPALMGLSTGTVALVARAIGARRQEEAGWVAGQSLLLAALLGGLTGVAGWSIADHLFRLLRAGPEVVEAGRLYLRISLLGGVTGFVLFLGTAALQGAGDTMRSMYLMALANVLNIVLDPLFIFGLGPFPRMGVSGAALATVLSQTIAAAAAVRLLLSGKSHLFIRRLTWRLDISLAWRILRIGIPGSGQMLSRSLMSVVLMSIVGSVGTAAVAAYGIGLRFHMLILMPAFALGGAAATMVGQNLGAKQPDRARRAAWLATGLDMLLMALSAGVMMLWARPMIGIFNADPEVVSIGSDYLRIVSPFYVMAALGIVLGRALNGAGDTVGPMVITIVSLWGLQVPLAVGLARLWHPAAHGIWWAITAATVANGVLTALWFETGRWRNQYV